MALVTTDQTKDTTGELYKKIIQIQHYKSIIKMNN